MRRIKPATAGRRSGDAETVDHPDGDPRRHFLRLLRGGIRRSAAGRRSGKHRHEPVHIPLRVGGPLIERLLAVGQLREGPSGRSRGVRGRRVGDLHRPREHHRIWHPRKSREVRTDRYALGTERPGQGGAGEVPLQRGHQAFLRHRVLRGHAAIPGRWRLYLRPPCTELPGVDLGTPLCGACGFSLSTGEPGAGVVIEAGERGHISTPVHFSVYGPIRGRRSNTAPIRTRRTGRIKITRHAFAEGGTHSLTAAAGIPFGDRDDQPTGPFLRHCDVRRHPPGRKRAR